MNKKLDTTILVNELKGASVFFKGSKAIDASERSDLANGSNADNKRTVARSGRLQQANTPTNRTVRTEKQIPTQQRPTCRYSFEFFGDQVVAIRRIRAEREIAGERLSLSDVVRDAMDAYIDNHKANNRTVGRSERSGRSD